MVRVVVECEVQYQPFCRDWAYGAARRADAIGGRQVKLFEIHAETRLVPNTVTRESIPWVDLYHAVVKGTEPDEWATLQAVCGAIVDPEPWGRSLRSWPAHEKRCEACWEKVREEVEAQIAREASSDWEIG